MTPKPDTRDICLVYASAATRAFEPNELVRMLAKAGRHNFRLDITGMLLYTEGSFFQVLEGNEQAVHALYEKIMADTRHAQAIKLIEERIDTRAFSRWSMGLAKVTRTELMQIPLLNDFFGQGSALTSLNEGRAKTLLAAFREGKWRRRLHG